MADVSTPLPAYTAMLPDWQLVDALKGGTRAMRAAARTYLPQWPAEDAEDYRIRLESAVLYPALAQTVENMVGRVFMRPIVLGESVPDAIRQQTADFDLQGSRLDIVAAQWFDQALTYGLSHLLIDYPSVEGQPRNLAEERQSGSRPYATVINPRQVIGWKSATVGGFEKLTQVRIKETVQEDDGDFGVVTIEQIRVLRRGSWEVYRAGEKGGWVLFAEGPMSVPDIPLVTLYTNRTGFMTATPPLIHLANLNVKHWQQQSEQDTNLHIARNPILFLTGIDDGEIKFGSRYALTSSQPDAKGSYIEHTGAAIAAGRQALEDLKDEMREAGARLLKKGQAAVKTATESRDDSINEQSQLGRMAQALEDALDLALQYMAAWQGLEQDAGAVAVNDDFDIEVISDQSVQSLVQMAATGQLSTQTLFTELQRRGILSDDLDWEAEQERIVSGGVRELV
jgi:hypothetical protein